MSAQIGPKMRSQSLLPFLPKHCIPEHLCYFYEFWEAGVITVMPPFFNVAKNLPVLATLSHLVFVALCNGSERGAGGVIVGQRPSPTALNVCRNENIPRVCVVVAYLRFRSSPICLMCHLVT